MKVLDELDRQSACGLKIKEYIEERLAVARVRNDGLLEEQETSRLRGKIATYKELLALFEKDESGSESHDG